MEEPYCPEPPQFEEQVNTVSPDTQKKKLANIGEGDMDLTTQANSKDGTLIEDGLDDKMYMIKSSGTIVDVSMKKKKKTRKIPMSVKKPTAEVVHLLSSQFKGREPTLFFPFPYYVGFKKKTEQRVTVLDQDDMGNRVSHFKIAESTNIYNAIVNSCKSAGMFLVDEDEMVAKKKFNEG